MLPEFDSGRRTATKNRSHELQFFEPKLPEERVAQAAVVSVAVSQLVCVLIKCTADIPSLSLRSFRNACRFWRPGW